MAEVRGRMVVCANEPSHDDDDDDYDKDDDNDNDDDDKYYNQDD